MIRLLSPVALALLLSGCLGSRIPFLPSVNINFDNRAIERTTARWERSVLVVSPEQIAVAWYTGFPSRTTEMAYMGIEKTCSQPPPREWGLVDDSGAREDGVWRLVPSPDAGAEGPEASRIRALQELEGVSLTVEEELAWLVMIPPRVDAQMVQIWGPDSPARALDARPCEIEWARIPMRTFWGILGAPSSGSGTGNTLDADRLAEETSLALDLIGVEEYDLQQMHQLAMTAEFGGSLPPGVSEEGARLLRERFLILLERRRGAQGVCELGRDRGLFALKLGMWRDEPTIPERYERYCTAERASPTVTPS